MFSQFARLVHQTVQNQLPLRHILEAATCINGIKSDVSEIGFFFFAQSDVVSVELKTQHGHEFVFDDHKNIWWKFRDLEEYL